LYRFRDKTSHTEQQWGQSCKGHLSSHQHYAYNSSTGHVHGKKSRRWPYIQEKLFPYKRNLLSMWIGFHDHEMSDESGIPSDKVYVRRPTQASNNLDRRILSTQDLFLGEPPDSIPQCHKRTFFNLFLNTSSGNTSISMFFFSIFPYFLIFFIRRLVAIKITSVFPEWLCFQLRSQAC